MTHTHTPGPWCFSYYSAAQARKDHPGTDGGGANGFIQKRGPGNLYPESIAFMPHNREPEKDAEVEANARLIASAPELLAALEDAEFLLRKAGLMAGPMRDSFNRSASDARAAIAKATGKVDA